MEQNQDDTIKEIAGYFMKWIGIVTCVLCLVSFFISSEWLTNQILQTHRDYSNDDSDSANFLFNVEILLINFAIWLKELPTTIKVIGFVLGGLLWFANSKD